MFLCHNHNNNRIRSLRAAVPTCPHPLPASWTTTQQMTAMFLWNASGSSESLYVMWRRGELEEIQWTGGQPSVPTTSPVVWPEHFNGHPSCLPFRSSLESSVVCLTLFYSGDAVSNERKVRVIIPHAELLRSGSKRYLRHLTSSSFRLLSLDGDKFAISGTRLITRELEVYDSNNARVQRALTSQRTEEATVQPPGVPYPCNQVNGHGGLSLSYGTRESAH